MDLQLIWFVLIGVLWAAYLFFEGFDFGVGMLLPVLGKGVDAADTERRRRVMLTSIGPFWDGNEVWLLTAGGATFAAFPNWYATMFSAMYLPLLLVLVALIVRNMGFEYRHKRDSVEWRRNWDLAIIAGSFVAPLLVGVALTNIVRGLPIDKDMEFTGNLLTFLNPMSLLGGLAVLALCLTHGSVFLTLKTDGDIRSDARAMATRCGLVAAVLGVVLLLWVNLSHGTAGSWVTTVLVVIALLFGLWSNLQGKERLAFAGTGLTMILVVATYFLSLYPNVMPTTLADGLSLTIHNASSTDLTLKIMTGAAVVFTPIVLLYTGWTYWVFRKRIAVHHIPDAVSVH